MAHPTFTQLRQLSLSGMCEALTQQLEQPTTYADLPFEERLGLLLEHELMRRKDRKQKRLIRQAQFKLKASVSEIDYAHSRNLNKSQLLELAQTHWLERAQNLLITGPCGSGKSFIGCALGHQACLFGLRVLYRRMPHLLLELHQSRADGSYMNHLLKLSKVQLLILDDWGLQPLKMAERHDLLSIFDDRYHQTSTAVISQLPTDQWHLSVADNTLADAILDRLMHNAHRIELSGQSMRKSLAAKNQNQ